MNYQIIISGGGPAGISAWLHLEKYAPQLAERTLLIEKAVFPRDKLCAGGIGSWGEEVLKHLEIELDIPSLFISNLEFKFEEEIYRLYAPNSFRVVQRIDFDHALVKTAINRGLDLHEGETLVDVFRDRNNLSIETTKKTYRVKVLIGADGALSLVRRKMFPFRKAHFGPTLQIFSAVDSQYDSEFEEKKLVFDFSPIKDGLQGYVWHFPCIKQGLPTIAHGIGDSRIYPNKPRAALKEIFSRELQARNIFNNPSSWSSHPIQWLSNKDIISQPNIILIGDAAGIEPALGGGIHIALAYGEIAAHSIVDAMESNNFSFFDYKKRLASHFVGKHINECTQLALDMYGGSKNPIRIIRDFFEYQNVGLHLLDLFLAGNKVKQL